MVPSSLDGLTDEQLAELEAQQGQPEITTGLVDRLAASPAPAQGFTDQQLDALPALASTPFARERGIALPPEAPAEPEPMTDYELNQLEEENYRRVDYIMPQEEFRQYWTRRKEENNEVGRFIDGVGQGAAAMIGMLPQAANEITDALITGVKDPLRQAERNLQTGAEIVRKGGINMLQLFDWVGNKANDAATWAKRRGLKQQALAKRLEQEGKLTGDELRDADIIAAAASEADAMEPTPVEEEEDFDKAYERYQREKALEQEFAGVTDFQIGASKVSAPAATKEAYQITDEQPAETLSMLGSMAVDPVNLLPVGAGALSKLRVLRRTATLAGAPLRGVQRAADATADLAERAEFGISSRVQDITGLTAKQQAALGAGAAGAAVYADQGGGGGNFTTAVTAIGSVLPGLRYGGAIIRKTGAAAGGAATIIREAGVGGIGTARAEAAADLARMTAIPERYRKYFTGYVDGTDSTLKRVAQDAGNPEALRRVARFADRAGVTTAARLADDVTSGAVAAGITGVPFAALQPDAERAGEVLGGIMALGGVAGAAGSAVRRGTTAADADIARMMADVYAVGGNIDKFSQLPHSTLDKLAAMQGMLASKVDFVPLRADEYRKNKDTSEVGGEFSAGLFLEKDANNRARIYINLDARPGQGGAAAIAPHEIGHAILTSNVLDGQPRNDLRNLVNQQYGPDGVQARGREYVARLVDGDIQNGTTGELPQVLTEQEFRDLESGNKSVADIAKGRKLEPSERERLINERYEELSQRSIERGEDALDWARDEIIAETFASEAPAIDFRAIRRDAAFPRLAESMLAAGGRVLEMMGVNLDRSTGRMLDNPSVLFRDNPLFQDRIMQRRVKEYVRAYDQYLTGLEEAGSATPRGVELARSSRPEDMARSTHVKLRDEGRGVLENDFLFQKPDGTYAYKPQKIITAAEANRAAQIKTLYDAKKFVPVNSTEFGKRKVNGREVIGGPVLPPQFDLFTQFPQHVREFARAMEASRAEGGSWNIDYNAIGTGSSGRYRITNMGAVRAIQRETVPFGWQVTKQNHLLAASLDLNAFRASAMKAINKGELGIFNNDMKQVEADLKTYLANHRSGMPGEATIGQQKRDTLNGLIGTGTAVQRSANPLYAELNPKGSIRTWRIDRLNDAQPSGRTGYFFDYDKINNNRMPQQIPREAQGMPDVAASGRGDGMSDNQQRVTSYHLTDDPNFSLDKNRKPQNNTTLGGDWPNAGIFVGDSAERWFNGYNYVRPFVVELSHPPIESMGSRAMAGGGYGGEKFIPAEAFDSVEVRRVIPYDEYARETFGEFGPIEEYFNLDSQGSRLPEPVAEAGTLFSQRPKDSLRNYRYSGKDVRKMSPAQRRALIKRTQDYARATRPEMFADQPSAAPRGQAMPDAEARSGAAETLDQLKRSQFIPTKVAAEVVGGFPEYLRPVAQFITDQRQKLANGQITRRDVMKAYAMTIASQGSGARAVEVIANNVAKDGVRFRPSKDFTTADKKGRAAIRPEEAAAYWLGTDAGQKALDNFEAGRFSPDDWKELVAIRKAYGDDRFNNLGAFNPDNIRTMDRVLADLNASRADTGKVMDAVQQLRGIKTGKKGFIAHLLGIGDVPTIDAVEINFWLTGKADIGKLNTRKATLARSVKESISDRRVSQEMFRRIDQRINALRDEVPGGANISPEVWSHVMHHWLWDKSKGIETTHEGMYRAQAQFMPDSVVSDEGGTVWRELQDAPVITLKDLKGRKVFAAFADLTSAGKIYRGIDSSEIAVPVETHGGPEWPLLQSEKVGKETNVWSNQGAGVSAIKARRANEGAIMLIAAMDKNAHVSNTETATAVIATNAAYARDGRITPENLAALDNSIRKEIEDFPGIESPSIMEYVNKLPFQGTKSRARIAEILESKKSQDLGAPNVQRILDEVRSDQYDGLRIGDVVLAIELTPGAPAVKLGEQGTLKHPSYQYGLRGRVIGRFARPINISSIFDDFYAQRRADGKPELGDRRAFDLAKPVQEITDAIASRIPGTPYKSFRSPRHAQLIDIAKDDKWRSSEQTVKAGGVSPAAFVDALNASPAKLALDRYTLKGLQEKLEAGAMSIYQLADAQVFFGIKQGDPASAYGQDPAAFGFGPNEKTLSLVLNNERKTGGMADAVVIKALQLGVTALDCFAVKSEKYPKGMLPKLYASYGFEPTGSIPFDPSFYSKLELADLKKYWKSIGWDESTGLPEITLMKWRGNDELRTKSLREIIEQGGQGVRGNPGQVVADTRSRRKSAAGSVGRGKRRTGQGDAGAGAGSQGDAGGGVRISRGFLDANTELLSLSPAELRNLGIQ